MHSPNFEKISDDAILIVYLSNTYSPIENEQLFENTIAPLCKQRVKVLFEPQAEWDLRKKGFVPGDVSTYDNLTKHGNYFIVHINLYDVREPEKFDYQFLEYEQIQNKVDVSRSLKLSVRIFSVRSKDYIYSGIVSGNVQTMGYTRSNGQETVSPFTLSRLYKKAVKRGVLSMLKHCGL